MYTGHVGATYTSSLVSTATSTSTVQVHHVPQSYSPVASTLPGPRENVSHSKALRQQIYQNMRMVNNINVQTVTGRHSFPSYVTLCAGDLPLIASMLPVNGFFSVLLELPDLSERNELLLVGNFNFSPKMKEKQINKQLRVGLAILKTWWMEIQS